MRNILGRLLAILLFLPLTAIACDIKQIESQFSSDGYDSVLKELSLPDCLGDINADEANDLVGNINKLTEGKKTVIALFIATRAALNAITKYSDNRALRGIQVQEWLAMSREISHSNAILGQVTADTSKADAQAIAQQALPKNKWQRIDGSTKGEIDLNGTKVHLLKPTNCGTETSCSAFESQRDMVRVFNIVMRIQKYSQDDSLAIQYADAQLQMARWEAYRSHGQHQYIWELWLNGQNMGEDLCPKDKNTGIQRGFCAVPRSQWIVLHPEAGLRWARSAQQSSELKPALIIETLGYYQWEWDKTTMANRLGASLVAAYTNERSGNKWSYGPMVHFGDGYNIAFTRSNGGTWGLLLNLNLADRYFGRKQEFVNYLKCLEKPNLGRITQGLNFCTQ